MPAITVGTIATLLAQANKDRKGLIIVNINDTNIVYIGDASVSTSGENTGIPLYPHTMIAMNTQDEERKKEWWGIATATTTVVVYETW